jgi:PilZ domain-containing protein
MDTTFDPWLSAPKPFEKRHVARQRVKWLARIRTEDCTFRCVVLDISHDGARLRLSAPILRGRIFTRCRVELSIEPFSPRWSALLSLGALRGEIVWQDTGTWGIQFNVDRERAAAIVDAALRV